MADDAPEDPESNPETEGTFDAVKAAEELAAALGRTPGSEAPEAPSTPTNYTAILEDEVEALQRALAEKDRALAEKTQALEAAEAKALEARAEVARARTRLERDAKAEVERKRRSIIASFLDVADDLDRAAQELAKGDAPEAIAKGVQVVVKELEGVLKQHDVRLRPALGQPFDSAQHEAIGTVPATEDTPEGTVAAVLSQGYEIGEETLRAARVVVAKG
ncbi:MAG: nucleotide exchange factor GrpE [Nannocystaceae bacterium]|nr:nucleotide exchange factor GrpE [bacterium]